MKHMLAVLALVIAIPTIAQADFVHAKGQVMFKDSDGEVKPFVHVQVRLMDSDSDYDEEIARGFTDHLGRYSLSGSAGDSPCIGCGKPDPYVKVVLEDPGRVEVHDVMHFTRNAVLTPIAEETAGEINFGTRTFTEEYPEGMAAILYAMAEQAYDRFVELSGDSQLPGNGGEVAIEIPVVLSFGTPYTTWDTIHWPGVKKDFGVFDHEFGHRLRHAIDGDVNHFNGDLMWYRYARHHERDEDTNLGFAFNEGWAHYFRHVMQEDFMDGPWEGTNKGNEVEGDVATKLITLSKNCGGRESFKYMWRTLKNNPGKIHSYPEFHNAFMALNPPCRATRPPNSLPTPRRPRELKEFPETNTEILDTLRDQMKKQIDDIDAKSRSIDMSLGARIPSAIKTQDQAVVNRLWQKRMQSSKASDTRARAAYRNAMSNLRPMTFRSIYDRTYELDVQAARQKFILAVAPARLREVQAIRADIVVERAKTRDPVLLSYLKRVDTRYSRLEAELRRAITTRPGQRPRLPLGILPRSFGGGSSGR